MAVSFCCLEAGGHPAILERCFAWAFMKTKLFWKYAQPSHAVIELIEIAARRRCIHRRFSSWRSKSLGRQFSLFTLIYVSTGESVKYMIMDRQDSLSLCPNSREILLGTKWLNYIVNVFKWKINIILVEDRQTRQTDRQTDCCLDLFDHTLRDTLVWGGHNFVFLQQLWYICS